MLFGALYTPEEIKNFSVTDGLVPTLIAIAIVFAVLFIIILCVNLLKLANKEGKTVVEEKQVEAPKKAFTIEDITDEDMMVAALVATIDYASETKKDVRLLSIKQIS